MNLLIRNKGLLALLAMLLMFVLVLAACNKDNGTEKEDDGNKTETPDTNKPDDEKATDDGPKMGGSVTGAMYSAPAGLFNPIFYKETYEANIITFTHEALVTQDEKFGFIPKLAKSWELNDDQTEITYTLNEGVKWHDGTEFTAHDVVYTYTAMADPDYVAAGGVRTVFVSPLVGYEEYNSGETDVFEGVVADGDYKVTFKFKAPSVNPFYTSSFSIIPKHIFEDIAVIDMPEAPESRNAGKVIGTGPFIFSDMIEREQYVLSKNADYWQGEPYLDEIVWKVIDQSVMTGLLEKGDLDFIASPNGIPPADYNMVSEWDHIEIIEQVDFGYQVLGFKHNHRTTADVEAGVLNPDNWVPNKKLADPRVRQAIAHAVNREAMIGEGHGKGLLHGRGQAITSPIAVQFWAYDENATVKYEYNLDKAAALLDAAGFVDVDGDGYREDPDGNEWVLNFDYPTGNELREKSAPIIVQDLDKAGIKVNLRQPKEMSAYQPDLTNDNTDWDLYLIGWSLGTADPDPSGLWGTTAGYNFSRWNNDRAGELLKNAMTAPEAFDQEYRKAVYSEWQTLFSEDLPALILYAQNSLWAYNKRLHGVVAMPASMYRDPHQWWVDDAQ